MNSGFQSYSYYLKTSGRCWTNIKHQPSGLHVEGKDERGAENKRRRKQWWEGSEICKKKYCSSLNHICNHFQSIYTRTYLLELCWWQIYLDNSSLFLFDYLLKSILTIKSFIWAKFSNPLSTNSLYWAYWAWIQSYLGPMIKMHPYTPTKF